MPALASALAIATTVASAACERYDPAAQVHVEKDGQFGSHRYSVRRDGDLAVVAFTPALPPFDEGAIAGVAVAIFATYDVVLLENTPVSTAPGQFEIAANRGHRFKVKFETLPSRDIAGARVELLQ